MEQATKHKALKGMLWTGIERLGTQVIQFVIGIIIARVLLPSDYGLIGMLAIFMGIAQTFIDSGFSSALIQKKDRNQDDYSTVFYFSFCIGAFLYAFLYFIAPYIAEFYNQSILTEVTRIYMLTLVINGFSVSQMAKLTVDLNFKGLAIATIFSIILSGAIGIYLAYNGFGVWSLVWQGVVMSTSRTCLIWIISSWTPMWIFSKRSFKRLFSFGSKLLASSLINSVYSNISTLIIGKAYQAADLGFFTRAQQFCQLPTQTITNIVVKVNFPILSQIQDDNNKLIDAYKILLRTPVYILYPVLFGLAILSKPLVIVLLGENWEPASKLIPILCFGCLWDPLTHINLNLLYVKGLSGLVLKLELIKKPIAFLMLFGSIPLGLEWMCFAISLYSFIAFSFNCYYTGKILNFGFIKQLKSLLPILGYCIFMSVVVVLVSNIFTDPLCKLLLGILCGIVSYIIIGLLSKDPSLNQLRYIFIRR